MPREVVGRADDGITDIGADADGHHVSRDGFAEPHAGIELALDDVGEAVVDNELHADVRVVAQERLQPRTEDQVDGVIGAHDADVARRLVA